MKYHKKTYDLQYRYSPDDEWETIESNLSKQWAFRLHAEYSKAFHSSLAKGAELRLVPRGKYHA